MDVILIYDGDFNDINLKEKINQLQKSIADIIETGLFLIKNRKSEVFLVLCWS